MLGRDCLSALFCTEQKRHINIFHINFLCRPSSPGLSQVCPRDRPREIGLPLCKIRRKPGFVPGFHRICPRDKPGEIPGTNPGSCQDQPDKKVYVYVPFSCLISCVFYPLCRRFRAILVAISLAQRDCRSLWSEIQGPLGGGGV